MAVSVLLYGPSTRAVAACGGQTHGSFRPLLAGLAVAPDVRITTPCGRARHRKRRGPQGEDGAGLKGCQAPGFPSFGSWVDVGRQREAIVLRRIESVPVGKGLIVAGCALRRQGAADCLFHKVLMNPPFDATRKMPHPMDAFPLAGRRTVP